MWKKKGLELGLMLLTWSVVAVIWQVGAVRSAEARVIQDAPLPYSATEQGPYTVKDNMILDARGNPYLFHGIARDGLEYDCVGRDGPYTRQALAFMGTPLDPDLDVNAGTYWGGNTVRLPLSQNFWLQGIPGDASCTPGSYQALVKRLVDELTSLKLNVMLDLHWVGANGQVGSGGAEAPMPDQDSITFWRQVASIYKHYANVLFELYNEPHISPQEGACWLNGCLIHNDRSRANDCACFKYLTYQAVGMQQLTDTIRSTGAKNLIIASGTQWGYDLTLLPQYAIKGENIVYGSHPYNYLGKLPSNWETDFGVYAANYPLLVSEFGSYDCGDDYVRQLLDYLDRLRIGWVAWSWSVAASQGEQVCQVPQLVTDYQGTPSAAMGRYIYQHLRGYVSDHWVRWLLTINDIHTFQRGARS